MGAARCPTTSSSIHPLIVLGCSLIMPALVAGLLCLVIHDERLTYHLYYTVPVGIPFIAFLFDRSDRCATTSPVQRRLDGAVVFLAVLRSVTTHYLFFFSGHALFLTYSVLTSRSLIVRISAALIAVEVL